jgi:hypothetical protein
MASDPMNRPVPLGLYADNIVPFLQMMADPTGSGEMSPEHRAMIEQVEANIAAMDAERPER